MSAQQLNSYSCQDFFCDNCQKEFQNEIAYSPAHRLSQLKKHHTYCANCAVILNKKPNLTNPKTKRQRKWEAPPLEASENLASLNIDKRSLTKTGRVYQLGTRVRKEFLEKLKSIAYEERLKYVEVLEKALECYEKHRN